MKKNIVLATLIAAGFAFAQDNNNTFNSPTVGFSVTKPSEWQFITADQNMENLSKTRLNDPEMQMALQKYATAPLVAMMKYPEPYNDLNPSFKVNIKPLGSLSADDPIAIVNLMTGPMARMLKDFKIAKPASETTVSGLKAAHIRIHYSLQIPDGREFPTASDLWIVPRGKFFFMLGAGTRQDGKTGSRGEIETILSSVKIQK